MSTDASIYNAAASLPPEMAIMKLENDNITAMATARPRNHESIKNDLLSQLDAYPSFAQSAIYSKPVGKDESGKMKYARGLSVRAAEALAESYGYCRVRSDVTIIDNDTVKVEATFTDYQRGRIWQDSGIVSKWYRDRYGKQQRHSDDRFFNVVVKAEASKRVREVIIRSVPPGLRAELQAMAEKKIAIVLSGDGIQKIVEAFSKFGVSLAQLENCIGRTIAAGWTSDDRVELASIYTALEAGETTVAEAFPAPHAEQQTAKTGVAGLKERLNGNQEQVTPPSEPEKEKTEEPKQTKPRKTKEPKTEEVKQPAETTQAAPRPEYKPFSRHWIVQQFDDCKTKAEANTLARKLCEERADLQDTIVEILDLRGSELEDAK